MPTIAELIDKGQSAIRCSESARLDAELLLCFVMDAARTTIYTRPEQAIPGPLADAYCTLIQKRAEGYPVAYLTGHREFWSIDLQVNEHTLIPRPETECLVECALQAIADGAKPKILDLGTGSGAIAIAIAMEKPLCRIVATDIDMGALQTAATNVRQYGLENISLIQCGWFAAIGAGQFDIIISNPPYVRNNDQLLQQGDIRFEPVHALRGGADGLVHIREIISRAPDHLVAGGWLLLEHGHDQGNAVRTLLEQTRYKSVRTVPDYAGNERITMARYG